MLQNGVNLKAVQEVLGHEHLNTTEIYTHIDNEGLRAAAKASPLSYDENNRFSFCCFYVLLFLLCSP